MSSKIDPLFAKVAHDLECASAAYAILIERAENSGNRKEARALRREFGQYRASALSSHDHSPTGK